ncbi:MAG: hypothetical protein ACI9FG_001884, partial [Crocinitomicaceae bacterium]
RLLHRAHLYRIAELFKFTEYWAPVAEVHFVHSVKILIILYDIESLSGWLEGQKLSYTATTPTDCGARCYGTRLDLDATGGGSVPFLGGSLGI